MQKHDHQMFPIEFLELISGHLNGVVKHNLLEVKANKFQIQFDRYEFANKSIVVSLFTKLVEAFKTIKDRYLQFREHHNHVRLEMEDNDEHFTIIIYGAVFIPPGKIFNLFSLILWYHIRFVTGEKPNQTETGKKLTEMWRIEEEHLRFQINRSVKKLKVDDEEAPCFICGELGYGLNEWEYLAPRNNRRIQMSTRVCAKHRTRLF